MDKTTVPSDSSHSGRWTNEKHVNFLNSMEASFVRTMLENNTHFLPLDRYLPDTSESTVDLKTHRRKKKATTVDDNKVGPRAAGSNSRRRNSYHPHTSSQDQVVPQLGNRRDDTDQNWSSNVHMAPSSSGRYLGF
ncbi:uncharacterized protein LOC123225174 [Mangifera indica]|uniref:uncharacterized protein LOC123225174 n=1 Tax=Mangifera indica TaxID=29780 RepID=UPI001CFA49DE|nr:uncharacterized protein LOC123225174 [Mangifera indica]